MIEALRNAVTAAVATVAPQGMSREHLMGLAIVGLGSELVGRGYERGLLVGLAESVDEDDPGAAAMRLMGQDEQDRGVRV